MPAPLPPLPESDLQSWRLASTASTSVRGERPATVGAAAVVLALAIVVLVVVVWSGRSPTTVAARGVAPAAAFAPEEPTSAASGTSTTSGRLVIDVTGAVARPGLVRLEAGSRVADAIAAAGGPTAEADLAQVNQARSLADGEQVRVPRRGEVLPAPGPGATTGSTARAGPIDLNAATVEDLDVLPGVGPATAAAIVEWRTRNGRFRSVEDLLEVPGIGEASFERLRSLVTV